MALRLQAPDAGAFAPFGRLISAPASVGERVFYSDHLGSDKPGCAPVLHVNHVPMSSLPLTISTLERHPHAQQAFVPLDVSRYVVTVAPSDADGAPLTAQARAFLVPGTLGVIYRRRVWHAGATVLDRPGHFAVLMWRADDGQDDVFRPIEPITVAQSSWDGDHATERRAAG